MKELLLTLTALRSGATVRLDSKRGLLLLGLDGVSVGPP